MVGGPALGPQCHGGTPGRQVGLGHVEHPGGLTEPGQVGADIEATKFKSALGRVMEAFRECNRYIDTRAPWTSRKSDRERTATTIHTCIQAVRTLGVGWKNSS